MVGMPHKGTHSMATVERASPSSHARACCSKRSRRAEVILLGRLTLVRARRVEGVDEWDMVVAFEEEHPGGPAAPDLTVRRGVVQG